MHPFRQIKVWHKAHELSVACHCATFNRPIGGSAPGFRSQFLRAVDSIGDNIAEGAGQRSQRQFSHYLEIAINDARSLTINSSAGVRLASSTRAQLGNFKRSYGK
jgi:four helix bundle protein